MPLATIIIPVYNAERYLCRCLDSIIAQTHRNWEAILIDDGSPDNSGTICDYYKKKDTRFKVIHQENRGVSGARQTGLDNATGEYIIHCDPDDWIEPRMLEVLIAKAREKDYDMVIADFFYNSKEEIKHIKQNIKGDICAKTIQAKIVNQELHGSLCNKLINKRCLRGISFTPNNISLGEDDLFNIRVLNNDIKIAYIPSAFYHYNVENPTSLCHKTELRIINSRKHIITELEKILDVDKFNNLYAMKKNVITSLFTSKQFHLLPETYPEIHIDIVRRGYKYNPKLPLGYFLSMAVKGHPRIAFLLYQANIDLLAFWSKIKKNINRIRTT